MTRTATFGVGKREGHDSSPFYQRFDSIVESTDITVNIPEEEDVIYNSSSEKMAELPDNSVALMVTSPSYHAGKDCDIDQSFDEYLDVLYKVFAETYRVLIPGGRAAINVANLGRKPYISLTSFVDAICLDIGYFPRGQIIWQKGAGANGSCAWGTFGSAKNPVLRDLTEYINVYSKGRYSRFDYGESTISKADFMRDTLNVWHIPPESAKRIGHPAPFPVELPKRLIDLYTYRYDLVLDPFMGSGTSAVAAYLRDRRYVGYELDPLYIELAGERLWNIPEREI